ncbi:6,7-dimethyl-8-ribityllumazine synthase [Rhodobacteraceae bacterium NNCM2]|nr:6,7-dimethyl-8-ribityllumazine synthase [Coraliihabitans acroporae]
MAETDAHTSLPLPEFNPAPRVLIVCAPYYSAIAEGLVAGASAVLEEAGATFDVVNVPGALEIPIAIRVAEMAHAYEGYVALGCVIRGETTHYDTVCNDSSRGLMMLGVDQGLAVGNGILTCENMDQAEARADPERMNKGGGAAAAALHLIALKRHFRPKPGGDRALPEDTDIILAGGTGLNRTA